MNRFIKVSSLFVIVLLFFTIICPINSKALSEQTDYIPIDDNVKSLTVDHLSFSDITFKDYSSTSSLDFGLTGVVQNNSSEDIDYTSIASYYDSNYNLIAQGYHSGNATSGSSNFNQMSNLSVLNGHNIHDIYFYRLEINTRYSSTQSDLLPTLPSKNSLYQSYDYVIDKYDINIIVHENNMLDVTEKITAYFNVPKHGIIRTIPLKNTITRLDGTKSTNRAQISNVRVDNDYKVSKKNGIYKLQIGSANHTLTGEQTYVIQYTYNLGKDPMKDYDELYYNIIGTEWDTVIGNVTFTITMPKKFDSSKLGFSSGLKGSTDNSNVKYSVSGNKITGRYEGILGVGEALTIRCELEDGYYVGAGLKINIIDFLTFLFPFIFLGIAFFIWYKHGRDEQVIETVEFYPPEGFNSLEVAFLYNGEASAQDVTSLLIYLANKGYIEISKNSSGKSFKITKLKDYDGNNEYERLFMEGLFKNGMVEVTRADLLYKFYITTDNILSIINTKENKEKIYEKSKPALIILIILMIIATFDIITIPPAIIYSTQSLFNGSFLIGMLFSSLGFTMGFALLFPSPGTIYQNKKIGNNITAIRIAGLVFFLIFGLIPWIFFVLPSLLNDPKYIILYLFGLICIFGMERCIMFLPKRTKYGSEMLGKINSFKKFLEVAESQRLEMLVNENPTYFYDILPFTYVLGISDMWIQKFDFMSFQSPDWYDCENNFSVSDFGLFVNKTMKVANKAMSSHPSSSSSSSLGSSSGSSGGSSSGGGSSGGGSGGGGGSSW